MTITATKVEGYQLGNPMGDILAGAISAAVTATAVTGILAFLGREMFRHWLGQLAKDHENEIKTRSEKSLIELRTSLSTEAMKINDEFRLQLTEESNKRTELYRNQLANDSAMRFEIQRSNLSRDTQIELDIAKLRQPAYELLWSLMEVVSPSRSTMLTPEIRNRLDDQLTSYYYQEGHVLYLSLECTRLLLFAKALLVDKNDISDQVVRDAFSALRTQMKVDLKVYTIEDSKTPIGDSWAALLPIKGIGGFQNMGEIVL